jgi:hypothetical protein
MSTLPVKFRLLQIIFQNQGISQKKILEILKEDYPDDRYVSEKGVEEYLVSLKAVGLIELSNITLDKRGDLEQFYKITNYGVSRMKYIS